MLLGAEDALYGIATRNGGKKKPIQIPGVGHVYQMNIVDGLGIIVTIAGNSSFFLLSLTQIFSAVSANKREFFALLFVQTKNGEDEFLGV